MIRLAGTQSAIAPQLSRYTIASAAALALDFAAYLALVADGLAPPLAGAASYLMGLTLHFSLSRRFVFETGSTGKAEPRLFGEFFLSGLVGLAITASVIVCATELLGLGAFAAKVLAAGTSFLVVYRLRRSVVFAPTDRPLET